MKEWYLEQKKNVLEELETKESGLTKEEVAERLKKYGENKLREEKQKSVIVIFLEQFKDLLVIILIIAAVISFFSGNGESTVVILAVITMNAILGTVQYVKAEKSLAGLRAMSAPSAKVIRDGCKQEVASMEIVPGDIVELEAGDLVVADGRILESYSLQVNESSLTGESLCVDKDDVELTGVIPLGERVNMAYSGSLVTYGRARMVVTGTGMDTEIGKIAGLLNVAKKKKTPLQESLDAFSMKLSILILIVAAVVFGISLFRKQELLDALMFAVALAVAAIPEALSSIVTIVQAMGTRKMAKENAIIKELKAVESLGCVSVICSDKTGTLTQNKMQVQNCFTEGNFLPAEELDEENPVHRLLVYSAVLTNDSTIVDGKGVGDPTEYALLDMFRNIHKEDGIKEDRIRDAFARIGEIPFDSQRKLMSTLHKMDGEYILFTKGAPDVLLSRCSEIKIGDEILPMTEEQSEVLKEANSTFSRNGLRVLAFAYRPYVAGDGERFILTTESEKDLIFLGLISMMDPPREESAEAVAEAKRAGIRPVMITGDHKITATAIAAKIGIYEEGDMALTGPELDAMTEEELDAVVEKVSVYGRVSPENKIRIVESWQRKGRIVAMTGDGVNDAPALKKADIGVAMGITGTEVSKDAASMILTDDNFATIIKAVANGRNVYRNIKNAVLFLLSGNTAAILAVLYTSFMGLAAPFTAVQLLFINLVTDSLPALAIGMEPPEKDLLGEKPRDPKEGLLTKSFLLQLLYQGVFIGIATMAAYYIGLGTSAQAAGTMAFATLTLARLFHGFNCRSKNNIFALGFRKNPFSLVAFLTGGILIAVLLFVPFLSRVFDAVALSGMEYAWIVILAAAPTVLIQGFRVIKSFIK